VLGAKIVLAGVVIVATLLLGLFVPTLAENRRLLWMAIAWALPVAIAPTWYFQGIENMRTVAALDVGGKAISSIGIFLLVRTPDDGWKMLAIQAVICTVAVAVNMRRVYRQIPFRIPTLASTGKALRLGWTMFLYRSSTALNTAGNALILGVFVLPQVVGYYSAGERIMKAFVYMIWPINQAFYPRLARLHHQADAESSRMGRMSLIIMGVLGTLCGVTAFVFAPTLVRVLLGKAFGPSVPVLRVLSLVLPLTAFNFVLGLQFMLPLGMDRMFNSITIGSGLLNLAMAVLLAPKFSAAGVAWAMVISQGFALICFCVSLRRANQLSYSFLAASGGLRMQSASEVVQVGSEADGR
jgi:PST family polysaccharide transporter